VGHDTIAEATPSGRLEYEGNEAGSACYQGGHK